MIILIKTSYLKWSKYKLNKKYIPANLNDLI